MTRILLFCLFATSFVKSVHGCNCVPIGTFCETITTEGKIDTTYLIVYGEVERKTSEVMHVRIIDLLFGSPSEEVLTIPNGYGIDCREPIAKFKEGSQYLFALHGKDVLGYFLLTCGVTSLEVTGGEVRGAIAPGIERVRIEDFATLNACGNIGTLLSSVSVLPTL